MKIGIYDPYLDTLGGGEKYMLSAACCLAKLHEVSIFWDLEKAKDIKENAEKRFNLDFNNINFVDNIFLPNTSYFLKMKEIKKYDSIIYLSDGSIPLTFSKNLIIHFQFPVEWVKNNFLTRIKINQTKNIICNSRFTKSYIDKKFNCNSVLIYPPVSINKISSIKKQNIILHVGRFGIDKEGSNYKKQDIMINSFKKMVENGLKDWEFILIISVKDTDKEKLKKLKSIADNFPIEIIENPKSNILWDYYNKAKVYWHASGFGEDLKKYPEKAEHFGISTAEAMGAGAVPVVINAGGQTEIVINNENGFLWDTTEELIEKTKLIISDNKLWERLSLNAITSAKKFSIERFCKEIQDIVIQK